MRLLSLRLVNVGPYADATLDAAAVHAAVVTGDNGAGKSSLLDAFTWAHWGRCRTQDPDRFIRLGASRMEVVSEFQGREGARYRVTRSRRVDLAQPKTELTLARKDGATWTALADGVREAQPAIIEACGLTYELALSTIIAAQGDSGRLLATTSGERIAVLERIIGVERFRVYAEIDGKAADAAEQEAQALVRAQEELRPLADLAAVREQALVDARGALAVAEEAERDADAREADARAAVESVAVAIRERDALYLERAGLAGAYSAAMDDARRADGEARTAEGALAALAPVDPTATPEALDDARRQLAAAEERLQAARATIEEARRLADEAQRTARASVDAQAALVALDEQIAAAERSLAELPAADPLATPEADEAARARLEEARTARFAADAAHQAARDAAAPLAAAQTEAETRVRETFVAAKADAHAATERAWEAHRAAQAAAAAFERGAVAEQRRLDDATRTAEAAFQRALRAEENASGTPFGDECGTRGCRFVADAFQLAQERPALDAQRTAAAEAAAAHHEWADAEVRRLTGAVTDAQRAADAATLAENALTHGENAPQAVLDAVATRAAAREAYAKAQEQERVTLDAACAAARAHEEADEHVGTVSRRREAARAEGERRAALAGRLELVRAGRPAAEKRRDDADAADRQASAAAHATPLGAAQVRAGLADNERITLSGTVFRLERALDAARADGERRAALQAEREAAQKAGRKARTRAVLAEEAIAAFDELHRALLERDLDGEQTAAKTTLGAAAVAARDRVAETATARASVKTAEAARDDATRAVARLAELTAEADRHWTIAADFRRLQRAHRDVPSLMIETVLPQIEDEANALLAKVSQTGLGVRFDTQRDAKSRAGKIEVLDVWVRDRMGERLYETYSGGERFRLDWAVRIATAYVLAARYGVALDMMWIDEGFGALDAQGLDAFAETMAATASLFDLVLTITHIDVLRDCFPTEIHVEWTAEGSRIHVLDATGRELAA